MIVVNCDQGSPEWFAARVGIPTASEFGTVLASGKGGGESVTRRKYLYKLAGEIITGQPEETYKSAAMERGNAMEEEARAMYAFMHDAEPERVGFIKRDKGDAGASPDSLLGANGGLEIKTCLPSILIGHMTMDRPPPEHIPQVQGCMWIAEREWWDVCLHWPGLPQFVKRVVRDDDYIAKLESEVERFNEELAAVVERVRGYGGL